MGTIGEKIVKEGQEISFQIKVTDLDYDTLLYSVAPLPSGASWGRDIGLFKWTPSYVQSGEYSIKFSVSDGTLDTSEDVKPTVLNVKKGKGKF